MSSAESEELKKEIERLKSVHVKELAKVKKASEKVIGEYKAANLELQKSVCPPGASASSSIVTDLSTLEADDSLLEAVSL